MGWKPAYLELLAAKPVDTPLGRFHNQIAGMPLKDSSESLERDLEAAVSRALRDNLAPLQRTADELHQAYADLVSACASTRPTNALPALLRAQTSAAALSAGLKVLSNFVTLALNPREYAGQTSFASSAVVELDEPPVAAETDTTDLAPELAQMPPAVRPTPEFIEQAVMAETEPLGDSWPSQPVSPHEPTFDLASYLASLPEDQQDLHRRANRAAKVTMQDIKLLKPGEVQQGRENKDICVRLRSDLDKARKEYDRRFRAILDHPVDYFHRWMVEILGDGDTQALGEYPYPSAMLRH